MESCFSVFSIARFTSISFECRKFVTFFLFISRTLFVSRAIFSLISVVSLSSWCLMSNNSSNCFFFCASEYYVKYRYIIICSLCIRFDLSGLRRDLGLKGRGPLGEKWLLPVFMWAPSSSFQELQNQVSHETRPLSLSSLEPSKPHFDLWLWKILSNTLGPSGSILSSTEGIWGRLGNFCGCESGRLHSTRSGLASRTTTLQIFNLVIQTSKTEKVIQ